MKSFIYAVPVPDYIEPAFKTMSGLTKHPDFSKDTPLSFQEIAAFSEKLTVLLNEILPELSASRLYDTETAALFFLSNFHRFHQHILDTVIPFERDRLKNYLIEQKQLDTIESSLRELGEQIIKDARYLSSVATVPIHKPITFTSLMFPSKTIKFRHLAAQKALLELYDCFNAYALNFLSRLEQKTP